MVYANEANDVKEIQLKLQYINFPDNITKNRRVTNPNPQTTFILYQGMLLHSATIDHGSFYGTIKKNILKNYLGQGLTFNP